MKLGVAAVVSVGVLGFTIPLTEPVVVLPLSPLSKTAALYRSNIQQIGLQTFGIYNERDKQEKERLRLELKALQGTCMKLVVEYNARVSREYSTDLPLFLDQRNCK